jgi:hypothetical protein
VDRQAELPRGPGVGRDVDRRHRPLPWPDREALPCHERCRTEAREQIRRAAPESFRYLEAAGDGYVAPEAGFSRAHVEQAPRLDGHWHAPGHRLVVELHFGVRAGHGHDASGAKDESNTVKGGL